MHPVSQGQLVLAQPTHLSKALSLGVFLEAECGKVDTGTENLRLGENADASNAVNLHLHVGVTVRIAKVSQMRPPSGVLRVTLHNDSIFIQGIGQGQRCFRLLPRIQVVGLLATKPVRQGSPNV